MGPIILITGANGFLGSSLVAYWSTRKVQIIASDIQHELELGNFDNVTYIPLNICDLEQIKILAKNYKFDAVVHCAALLEKNSDINAEQNLMSVNLDGTRHIVRLASEQNARLIFPSTAMVYGNNQAPYNDYMPKMPTNLYALTKSLGEDFIEYYGRCYNLSYAIVRITIIYGPNQKGNMLIPSAIETLSKGLNYEMTKGEQSREFVYIDDILSLIDLIRDCKTNGIFHGGIGTSTPIIEVVKLIKENLNSSSELLIGKLPYRPNEIWDYSVSFSKNNKIIGWQPKTTLVEGIQKTIAQYIALPKTRS